jgi:hypothetical protein
MRTTRQTRIELDKGDDVVLVFHPEARVQVHVHGGRHCLRLTAGTAGSSDGPSVYHTDIEVIADVATLKKWMTHTGRLDIAQADASEGQGVSLELESKEEKFRPGTTSGR